MGHVKLNVADEDKCKSHLVTENDIHSSWANLSRVADRTDIASLIPRHIFEAKSSSKQPANTPLWIRSWARSANTNYSTQINCQRHHKGHTDRQADGQVGKQTEQRSEKDTVTSGLMLKEKYGSCCTRGGKGQNYNKMKKREGTEGKK